MDWNIKVRKWTWHSQYEWMNNLSGWNKNKAWPGIEPWPLQWPGTLNPLTSLVQSAWLAQWIAERCVRSSQRSGFFFNRLGCSFYCEDHVLFHTNDITKQKQTIEPFLKTSNTFHLRLARQISSTDPLIEWSVACYPGSWSTCRLVLDSSSNSPAGHHTVHTQ